MYMIISMEVHVFICHNKVSFKVMYEHLVI